MQLKRNILSLHYLIDRNSPNIVFRLRNRALNSKGLCRLIWTYLYYRKLNTLNSEIPLSAKFADCPVFPHGIRGVFISSGAEIGRNCCIFQQVTIGSNTISGSKGYGAPVIGNGCYIGAGAKVVGGVKIGDNVRIGANCVVVTDVPNNSTVVMEKPRIIEREEIMDNRFTSYKKL